MGDEAKPLAKRRLAAGERLMRRMRIFARLRDGWGYDDIARAEGLTGERIRQIVAEVLRKRAIDDSSDHAKLQLERLAPAMRLAADAIAGGDVRAIAAYLKVLDRLDKYQQAAGALQQYDDEAREKLLAKINAAAARIADRGDEASQGAPTVEAEAAHKKNFG